MRECDAGVEMGIASIDDVLEFTKDEKLKKCLEENKKIHENIQNEIESMLDKYGDDGKAPNPVAKGMSWLKTNTMLTLNESDKTIADLITDGCNMGVKTLNKYLNQYEAADEASKDITKRIINLESALARDIRQYL